MKRRRKSTQRASTPPVKARPAWQQTLADLAILAAIWLIFTLPFLIAGRSIVPADWHGVTPAGAYGYSQPHLPYFYSLDADASVGSELAWYKYTADSYRAGHLPFWNPYQHFGIEHLSEGGALVLYPFSFLHLLLPRQYWDLPQFLQFYIAAVGLYFLAREYGLVRRHAIFCGACAFAAGHLQALLCVTVVMVGMVWTPFLLLSMERVLRTGSIRAGLLPGVAGTFLLSTSCNPGLGIILVLALAAYAIARAAVARQWTALPRMVVPFAIGGLCSAPVLLPFLQNAAQFKANLGSHARAIHLVELPAVLLPYLYSPMMTGGAFGDPTTLDGQYWVFGYAPPLLAFLAMAGAVLAVRNRHRAMLVVAGVAAWLWLWALGVPPFNFATYVPVLTRLSTSYIMQPIQLFLCVLAGYAVATLTTEPPRTWLRLAGAWFVFLAVLVGLASSVYRRVAKPDMEWVWKVSAPAVAWAVVPVLVLVGACWIRSKQRSSAILFVSFGAMIAGGIAFFPSGAAPAVTVFLKFIPLAVFLAIALLAVFLARSEKLRPQWGWTLVIVPLLAMNIDTLLRRPAWPARYDLFTAPPFVKYLHDAGPWRTYMNDLLMFGDFPSAFEIPSVNLLGDLLPYPGAIFFQRFLNPYEGLTNIYGIARAPGAEPEQQVLKNRRYWDYAGVRYLVTHIAKNIPLELLFRDPAAAVWRNNSAQPIVYLAPENARVADWREGQDRFAAAADLRHTAFLENGTCPYGPATADVTDIRIEPNTVSATVDARAGGTLVLVSNYAPGWSARINGTRVPVYRANGAFQAACLAGPGKYQVSFNFVPPMWYPGLACAALGIALCVWIGVNRSSFAR